MYLEGATRQLEFCLQLYYGGGMYHSSIGELM